MTGPTLTLSAIVSRRVALEQRTADRYLGNCPFHDERTPSFMVDDQAGRFHCLGCGARGDAVDFVLRTEPLLFRAIIAWLGRI